MIDARQPGAIDPGRVDPGPLGAALDDAYRKLARSKFADALWAGRLDVWSADPAVQQQIGNRLGWLDMFAGVSAHTPRVEAFAKSLRDGDISDVVLLGMGGRPKCSVPSLASPLDLLDFRCSIPSIPNR